MKRGQITLFVIIGLVLLLIVGLMLLPKAKQQPVSLQARQDADLVTNYVQQCLNSVGEDSVRQVGLTGGYLTVAKLKDIPGPNSQVATIIPQKIPLWHEIQPCDQSKAGCIQDHRPALCAPGESCPVPDTSMGEVIQTNIEALVVRNIDKCLGGFKGLQQQIVKTTGSPKAHAVIREDDTEIVLTYPMTVTILDNQTFDLDTFHSSLDVKLPQTYRLARSIQLLERSNGFLEEIFLHLLSIYTGIDQPLPPFRDLQVTGPQYTWQRSKVQQNIEDGILPFMDFVQIINAGETFAPIISPNTTNDTAAYANGIYQYLAIKLNENTTYPLGVKFEYPRTPMYLDINGQEYLRPRQMPDIGGMLSLLGINLYDYRFKYTAAFPMVVHITDPYAFNGRGFEFDYGLETNVKNNIALNTSETVQTADFATSTLNLATDSQLVNHLYNLKVTDRHTGLPLSGARVSYACGTQFYIGDTDAAGTWVGKLPYCITGGYLLAEKEGYARTGISQNNANDDGMVTFNPLLINLWPRKSKTVVVYKRTVTDVGNISAGGSSATYRTVLGVNDSVTFTVQRIKESPYDEDVPLAGVIQFGGQALERGTARNLADVKKELADALKSGQMSQKDYDDTITLIDQAEADKSATSVGVTGPAPGTVETQVVDFVPGTYNLEGTLMYNAPFTLPPKPDKKAPLPEQNFSNWVSGGVVLKDVNGVALTENDVYNDKKLVLYVLEEQIPRNWDELMKNQAIDQYQTYDRKAMVVPMLE